MIVSNLNKNNEKTKAKQTNRQKTENAGSGLVLMRVLHLLGWCYYHRVTKSKICLGIFQFVLFLMLTHIYIDASSFIFPYKDFKKQKKLCLRRGL